MIQRARWAVASRHHTIVFTVNFGIRQKLTDHAILIASLGHEVRTPADQPLAFIGYCGVQLLY